MGVAGHPHFGQWGLPTTPILANEGGWITPYGRYEGSLTTPKAFEANSAAPKWQNGSRNHPQWPCGWHYGQSGGDQTTSKAKVGWFSHPQIDTAVAKLCPLAKMGVAKPPLQILLFFFSFLFFFNIFFLEF
jgi:hypothetical protein